MPAEVRAAAAMLLAGTHAGQGVPYILEGSYHAVMPQRFIERIG